MRMLSLPLHSAFWDVSDLRLRKVRKGAWCLHLLPSSKQKVFLKHCCCYTRLHGVTYKTTVILPTPSDPTRYSKFSCMMLVNWNWMYHLVCLQFGKYTNTCANIWSLWDLCLGPVMVQKSVCGEGGTCMISYCHTCQKPCLAQYKIKRWMLMGWHRQVRQYLHFFETACKFILATVLSTNNCRYTSRYECYIIVRFFFKVFTAEASDNGSVSGW